MIPDLQELIELARHIQMSPEEEDAQRIGFAYGNARLHDPSITREMVADAAHRLKRGPKPRRVEG